MELRRLDWEIWDLAWAKETEKLNETMSLKKTKIEELSERKKDLRNFKDSLNSNINTDDSILLRELEKMENPKAEELIKLIQEKKDSKEIIEKLNILIPDSIEPTIHEIEGKSDLLKLKKLEEKRFTQKTNLSSQLTDELQEILKIRYWNFQIK